MSHMFNDFDNDSGYGPIIQKIGRICGKDDSTIPRYMYMRESCIQHVKIALEDSKTFIDLCECNQGKTGEEILNLASENEKLSSLFKNLCLDKLSLHKDGYKKRANSEIRRKLEPALKRQRISTTTPTNETENRVIENRRVPCDEFIRDFEHDLLSISELMKEHGLEHALTIYTCVCGRNDNTFQSICKHLINEDGSMKNLNDLTRIDPQKLTGIEIQTFRSLATVGTASNHGWRNGITGGHLEN